jgi:hypothetical protein
MDKRQMTASVLAAGVLGMASLSQAAVTVEVVNLGAVTGLSGYTAFQVLAKGTQPNEVVTAMAVQVTGPLHQRWTFNEETEAYDLPSLFNTNSNPASGITRFDSHFLFNGTDVTQVSGRNSEDNSLIGSPLANTATSGYGLGSKMQGVFGLPTNLQANQVPVLYLVVANDQQLVLSSQIPCGGGGFGSRIGAQDQGKSTFADVTIAIPEPMSLSLLALAGGVLMLKRK